MFVVRNAPEMNLKGEKSSLLFANFNQDFSGLSLGTTKGYKVLKLFPSVSTITQQGNKRKSENWDSKNWYNVYFIEMKDVGGVGIAEMLFLSSLGRNSWFFLILDELNSFF